MKETKDAKQWWSKQKTYPKFGVSKLRRFYELQYLVPQLKGKSLLDLGCGDGALLRCLLETTDIKKFYGYDIAPDLLKQVDKRVETKVFDCEWAGELPKTDITIIAGVLPSLIEDKQIDWLLECVESDIVFIRSTCYKNDLLVNDEKRDGYTARYRTVGHVIELIQKKFKIEDVRRIYPDKIESKYGTKQYYFKAVR